MKNLPANAGDVGLIPGLDISPGEENGNPLQHSCLGNPTERGAGGLWSLGSQRMRNDWVTNTTVTTFYWYRNRLWESCEMSQVTQKQYVE